jgi:uncharacterized membrane protein
MSSPPFWALSLTYWLHMLATVVWIGGLSALALILLPAARSSLETGAYSRLLEGVQRRLDPLGWLSLAILVGTGLFQMSANPNYQGFLAVNNRWAMAILVKHGVFAMMVVISAYLSWGLLPRLRRAALQRLKQPDEAVSGRLHDQEARLVRINLLLGILVLALTALARAS